MVKRGKVRHLKSREPRVERREGKRKSLQRQG